MDIRRSIVIPSVRSYRIFIAISAEVLPHVHVTIACKFGSKELVLLGEHVFDQLLLVDLPHGVAGYLLCQLQQLWYLVRRQTVFCKLLQGLKCHLCSM